jgi:enamine deaminase RidA (YjgF/YER057c/UK114 family)
MTGMRSRIIHTDQAPATRLCSRARATVAAAGLPRHVRVEIEAIALVG